MRLPRALLVIVAAALALSVLLGFVSLRANRERQLLEGRLTAVKGFDRDLARHLAHDDASAWRSHCRAIGIAPLSDATAVLLYELTFLPFEEFRERRLQLFPSLLKLADAIEEVSGFRAPARSFRILASASAEHGFEMRAATRRSILAFRDSSTSWAERAVLCDSLASRLRVLGNPHDALCLDLQAATAINETGDHAGYLRRTRVSLEEARRLEEHYLVCQLLGALSHEYEMLGRMDSAQAAIEEGARIARRYSFLDQATRLLIFQAFARAFEGRLALAADLFAEARRVSQLPGGERVRLRVEVETAKFNSMIECWDLVESSLRRVRPLLRENDRLRGIMDLPRFEFDTDRLQARVDLEAGRADLAQARVEPWLRKMPLSFSRVGYAKLFDTWSAGLLEAGRPQDALTQATRGLAHCDTAAIPDIEPALLLTRAKALQRLGLSRESSLALRRLRRLLQAFPHVDERTLRDADVLQARLLDDTGAHEAARSAIRKVLHRVQRQLREQSDGLHSYLVLEDARDVRDAVHGIERLNAVDGYRFEMDWRTMTSVQSSDLLAPGLPRLGEPGIGAGPRGTHLLYRFTRDRLLRWTVTPTTIRLDTLNVTPRSGLAAVREALALMQIDEPAAGQVLGPRVRGVLDRLSSVLLPPDLASLPAPLHVTPDGPLMALPFEALLMDGPGGRAPIATWRDIAYVQGWGPPARATGDRAVIVADPNLSDEFGRRYSLAPGVASSGAELRAAHERWPGARVLRGQEATKANLLAALPGASFLYLAAHHVRDPQAPFLGFVPLAAPPNASPEAALLEIRDVRRVDLSTCRLAVLASCASGAPYRLVARPGPSLGSSFLDAGAGAVVQSYWDVEEAETAEFMRRFLHIGRTEPDPVTALARARRDMMATPAGAKPRVWAAWAVHQTMPRDAGGSRPIAKRAKTPPSTWVGAK